MLVGIAPVTVCVSSVGSMVVIRKTVLVLAYVIMLPPLALPLSVLMLLPLLPHMHFIFIMPSLPFVHKRSGLVPAAAKVLLLHIVTWGLTVWATIPLMMSFFFLVTHIYIVLIT